MSERLTARQQRFVTAYLSNDGNASLAYRQAGYNATTDNALYASASKLLRVAKVADAIQAQRVKLATRAERKTAVTHTWLVSEYVDTYHEARDTGDLTAARMTLDSLGRLTGLLIDQRRVTVEDQRGLREELSAMTLAEVIEIRADLVRARDALPAAQVIDGDVVR